MDDTSRANFYRLMFRTDNSYFLAFDALSIDGEDLTAPPLLEPNDDSGASCHRGTASPLGDDALDVARTPLGTDRGPLM